MTPPPVSPNLFPQLNTVPHLWEEGQGQGWLHTLQDPVQNENAGLPVPKTIKIFKTAMAEHQTKCGACLRVGPCEAAGRMPTELALGKGFF